MKVKNFPVLFFLILGEQSFFCSIEFERIIFHSFGMSK